MQYRNELLSVSHICKFLRGIALGNERFWAKIRLELGLGNDMQEGSLAREWLKRSGERPISFTLYATETGDPIAQDVIGIFVACPKRWDNVRLHGLCTKDVHNILSVSDSHVRDLSVRCSPRESQALTSKDVSLSVDSTGKFAKLKALTMDSLAFPRAWIPREQLLVLHLVSSMKEQSFSFPSSLEILRACPNLGEATLSFHQLGKPTAPIRLRQLHTLHIYDNASPAAQNCHQIWAYLELPALCALSYEGPGSHWISVEFCAFLRSAGSLRKLSLRFTNRLAGGGRHQLAAIFNHTHSLEEFSLVWRRQVGQSETCLWNEKDNLFTAQALGASPKGPVRVPRLRSITLDTIGYQTSFSKLILWIYSRWHLNSEVFYGRRDRYGNIQEVQPLEKVIIYLHYHPYDFGVKAVEDHNALSLLEEMEAEGLDVTLLDRDGDKFSGCL